MLEGPFRHEGPVAPGDPSSAAFLPVQPRHRRRDAPPGVGLNPSRLVFLEVLERMGVQVVAEVEGSVLGEPVGNDASASPHRSGRCTSAPARSPW